MKKFILFALAIFFVSLVQAQFVKGDRYLMGNVSANINKSENALGQINNYTYVILTPSVMQFRSEKKAVGFGLSASYNKNVNHNGAIKLTSHEYSAGAGIFVQNILPLSKGFYLYSQQGLGGRYIWGDSDNNFVPDKDKISGIGGQLYITPGLGYKFNNRLVANLSFNNVLQVSYEYRKTKRNSPTNSSFVQESFNLGSGLFNGNLGFLGFTLAWKLN